MLPSEAMLRISKFVGARRCCTVMQVSKLASKNVVLDRHDLRRALSMWALNVVEMTALQPAHQRNLDKAGTHLGRWSDFSLVSNGAGHLFVKGPALLRCCQRFRLRARAQELLEKPIEWPEEGVEISLHQALRRSAAKDVPADSIHSLGSAWDALDKPATLKRKRGAENGSQSTMKEGLFSVRRWDALMDPQVPWRLRFAAFCYHHHAPGGCTHQDVRQSAEQYICRCTRHDEKLRHVLLDEVDAS